MLHIEIKKRGAMVSKAAPGDLIHTSRRFMENFHDMNSRMETRHQFQRLFLLTPKTHFYKLLSHKQMTKLCCICNKCL